MNVKDASSGMDEVWREFVENHPDATPYHLPEWRRVSEVLGHRPRPLVVLDDQGRVQGVLPLFEVRTFRGRRLVAVPLRDRGGPLATSEEAMTTLLQGAVDLAEKTGVRSLTLRSNVRIPAASSMRGISEHAYHLTTTVPLSQDTGEVLAKVKSNARRSARKGTDAGLEFRWGKNAEDLESFYGMFVRTRRKLGVPPYPKEYLAAMWDLLAPSGVARLALTTLDGEDVAGVFLFAFGDRVIYGYAASDERSLTLRPNDFLVWNLLQEVAREGFALFDFGASSPHQEGLLRFKEKWGGQHSKVYTYSYPARGDADVVDSNRSEFQMVRAIWRHMPLFLTTVLGKPIVRRLG